MRVAMYVPHGALPDRRGFAPAIVAWVEQRFAWPVAARMERIYFELADRGDML